MPLDYLFIYIYIFAIYSYIIYIGVGFGLSISKQLTEAMRGNIHFESKLEIGSKFAFSIPLPRQNISTDDYPALQLINLRNISSTEIILKSEMTIPNELFNETDRNLLPHLLQAEANQEEEGKFFESSVNPLLLDVNSEKSNQDDNKSEVNEKDKVLIVDDTAINIFAMQNLLRKLKVESDSVKYSLYCIYIYILLHRHQTD